MRNTTTRVVSLRPTDADERLVGSARRVFQGQISALEGLFERVDGAFASAVHTLYNTPGHVALIGVGKSGVIAKKLAATFASTGTPAFFINAAEAHHGDLGMVTPDSTAVLISHSGETDEVTGLLPHLRGMGIPLLALVGNLDSTLGTGVDVALDVGVEREVCPNNLAPTASTLATLAMGDALAVALMELRGFCSQQFARFHPGGSLGRRLGKPVSTCMRTDGLPVVSPGTPLGEALNVMSDRGMGLVLVMKADRLVGLVTDGDLRRAVQRHDNVMAVPVSEIMTTNPVTVREDTPLVEARSRMQQLKLKALVVLGLDGRVRGVVDVFDGG